MVSVEPVFFERGGYSVVSGRRKGGNVNDLKFRGVEGERETEQRRRRRRRAKGER